MRKFFYTFAFILCALMTLQAETMVVATYNLRNANGSDSTNGNGWGQRYPYIAQIVQFHGFDIFGTQEGKYPPVSYTHLRAHETDSAIAGLEASHARIRLYRRGT